MKKVISVLLLLAMVVGCFVGCAPETKDDPALNAAAEYLYAMYKDAEAVTSNDYTVVAQVRINDVTYPITWTSDKADNVKIEAGENGMATVKITASTEDVNYKLTATLKNAEGATASVSFDHIIPAKAAVAGKTVVLAYPKENKFITGSHYLYTGKNKWQLELTENEAEAIALEVVENSDGTVTLKAGDKFLFCDATHVKFVDAEDDNTKFVLEAADTDGGYYVKCAVANYGGKAQYLEVYSGYLTCYGMGSDPSIYVFKLQESTTAAGTISGLEETPAPDGGNTTPPASTPPASTPPASTPPAGGNSGTTTPASGSKVVFSFPKENKFVTGKHYSYTSSSGKTKMELELTTNKAEALAMEMIKNSDNSVTFKAGGQYLFSDGTDVKFVSSQSDNTKFVLETADGGYYIKCFAATYQDKPQYLEVYSGYLTVYSLSGDMTIFTFKLDSASGANGTISAQDGSNAGSSSSGGSNSGSSSSGNSGNSGNSGSSTPAPSINGKLAASIDMKGTTTRTGFSSTQTVHSANGITYTNDKASSQTANVDMTGKTTAARAYKSSTVKIEYTGMVAIVFNLDDYNSGDYLKGFDNMTVSGATITRNGSAVTITFASATNVFQSAELGAQVRIISIDVYTAN